SESLRPWAPVILPVLLPDSYATDYQVAGLTHNSPLTKSMNFDAMPKTFLEHPVSLVLIDDGPRTEKAVSLHSENDVRLTKSVLRETQLPLCSIRLLHLK
ncbi:hypothetical protein AVEN_48126-1, partial [Araneus ventricosus]